MSLADRLRAERRARFVGRHAERALFEAALRADALPFHVLHVVGPGGVGKTALLAEFGETARALGVPAATLDGRDLAPTPEALRAALAATGLALDGDHDGRQVLLVDTAETLAPLDGWLRDDLLPSLPGGTLVVLAGRLRPSPAWRADPGWQALSRELPLRNLAPDESRALLGALAVPPAQHEAALAFTHGHPLALALVAEAARLAPGTPVTPTPTPDIVGALLRRLLDEALEPPHRAALEACALLRTTTEAALAALLDVPADAPALFAWLRERSFVEAAPAGLVPHDLARDVLSEDLRWRHPERFAALHARARRHYTARLHEAATPDAQQLALVDYAFLYRDNPVAGPLIARLRASWQAQAAFRIEPAGPADGPALRALVARHEGEASAALFEAWAGRDEALVEVIRGAGGEPAGLLVALLLGADALAGAGLPRDPAVDALGRALRRHGGLREGERALLFRFWMDADAYQGLSAVQSVVFARTVWHYLATPGLAVSVFPCAAPHDWAAILRFADQHRLPEGDFETGGRRFEAFGHDWRAVPPEQWLDGLAGRELVATAPPADAAPALLVLSAPDFADAVKTALQHYARPHLLRGHPLLRSRLVTDALAPDADEPARIEALRARLETAVAALEEAPREASYARAVRLTYLKPAPSQSIAAERLDLPFSTFRRHLGRGIERVTEALWAEETAVSGAA